MNRDDIEDRRGQALRGQFEGAKQMAGTELLEVMSVARLLEANP